MEEVAVEEREDWGGLDDEGITERVALFLAKLRSNSANTLTSINHVMWHMSDLVSDTVGNLQTKTMALFDKFGHLQSPEVEELRQVFEKSGQPFKVLKTEYRQRPLGQAILFSLLRKCFRGCLTSSALTHKLVWSDRWLYKIHSSVSHCSPC